ncbi:MAG: hypothetical protein JWP82_2671, partial [Humibacillus sp.]|nr:hypothetical protein [Humibacillus sp.]
MEWLTEIADRARPVVGAVAL